MRNLIRILTLCCLVAAVPAADPVLAFSDLTSGPATGNGDTSRGQTAGQDGAIVTVWGRALGSIQGTSSVRVNGVTARIYSWGDATAPANLSTRHHLQMVCFQIDHATPVSGAGITVTVGGATSNALPFTIRAGAIRFVTTSGNDSGGSGAWTAPWRTIIAAVAQLPVGGICYVCDGVDQTTVDDYAAAVNLSSSGVTGQPKALVVYPGARSHVGSDAIRRGFGLWNTNGGGSSSWWTIAKFDVTSGETSIGMATGFRAVGNRVSAPTGSAPEGVIEGQGDHLALLGNEVTQCGASGCSKLYHPIYISSWRDASGARHPTETDREIAWTYAHDNNANRAINIYSEQASTAFMTDHRIHHNWIENQVGDGMLIGYYVVGENWIYDNVVVHAGLGPEPTMSDAVTHSGVQIDAGHESFAGTTIHFCNNTVYGCGFAGAASPGSSGMLYITDADRYTLDFRNNLVVSTGQPYLAAWSGAVPGIAGANLWFGNGAAPAWNSGAISGDPLFVATASMDFHLAAGSPAIDRGSDAHAFETIDFDAVPRPQGAAFDLGAFERIAAGGASTGGSSTTGGAGSTGSGTTTGTGTSAGSGTGGGTTTASTSGGTAGTSGSAVTSGGATAGGSGSDQGSAGGHCGFGGGIGVVIALAFLRVGRRRASCG